MIEKLIKIQQELKVPKNQRNTFGNYNYRSCEDIVEAAKPLCHAEGLILTLTDEVVEVGGRVYVKSTACVWKAGGAVNDLLPEWSSTGWAREAETKKGMDEAQITGSASSYARKYALNGLFAIDDTKDADTNEQREQVEKAPARMWTLDEALEHVSQSTSEADLTKRFKQLSATMQKDGEVIAKCTELKKELTK